MCPPLFQVLEITQWTQQAEAPARGAKDISLLIWFPGGSVVKNLPANAEDVGLTPGLEEPLEEEMATHSNILAWRIP